MAADRLDRLLRPRTIAAIGGREAAAVVEQGLAMGFAGEIWPVHPARAEMHGHPCFRSIEALPRAPDAAFVAVERRRTVELVRALREHGAGGAVCYASGFKEAASLDPEGAALEAGLLAAAGPMPLLGPNGYGLLNYLDGVALWPDQQGGRRLGPDAQGVAILTQSSNVALNLTMQTRGLPIAYMVAAGNQAQGGLARIALSLLEDERVTAIGLHLEGVGEVSALEELALAARRRRVPLVALKVGRSAEARAAGLAHTAALNGSDAAAQALLARLGIAPVRSLPAFLETLKLLHVHGPLPGFDIASLSCSGGDAALVADAVAGTRLRLRPLTAEAVARVQATLGPLVTVANPLDYHTFIWSREGAMAETFAAMLEEGFDLAFLVLDLPRPDRCRDEAWRPALDAWRTALRRTDARGALVATLSENMDERQAHALIAEGLAPLLGLEEAMAAIEAAATIGVAWRRPEPAALTKIPARLEACASFDEAAVKQRLAVFGVPIPYGRAAATAAEAAAAATALGYPVALKALGLAHKSEHDAVRLGLRSSAEVEAAARALLPLSSGLLVERMIEGSVAELLVGVTREPGVGLLLTLGFGGVLAELVRDRACLLLPTDAAAIRDALLGLRMAPLLTGYRGRPPADLDAAVAAIQAIGRFALVQADRLEELEINPLIVRAQGGEAFAVDALLRMEAIP